MKIIKSCGFVVYTDVLGERRYLVIESLNGDVGFPKGHVEAGESELETAIRELSEEVGIKALVTDKSADVSRNAGVKVDAMHDNDTAVGVGASVDADGVLDPYHAVGNDATDDVDAEVGCGCENACKSPDVSKNKPFRVDAVVVDGFYRRVEYIMPGTTDAVKQVVYFLCRCFNTDVLKCQETEVRSAEFMTFDDASEALTFREMKEILSDTEKFLSRR